MEFSDNYRFDSVTNSLYKYDVHSNAFIHCARVPFFIHSLAAAVKWYEGIDYGYPEGWNA